MDAKTLTTPLTNEDLLRRVFVPIEHPITNSRDTQFKLGGTYYVRDYQTQTIHHATPKARGKAARRAEKIARRAQKAK